MDSKEAEFLKRLRATFKIEADEHLGAMTSGLIELEKASKPAQRAEIIEAIFREAHSLKGAARSVNLMDAEAVCQSLESAFSALKNKEIILSPALFDLFHQALDAHALLVTDMQSEPTPLDRKRTKELSSQINSAAQGGVLASQSPSPESDPEPPKPGREAPSGKSASPAPSDKPPDSPSGSSPPQNTASPGASRVTENIAVSRPDGESSQALAETVRIPIAKLDPLLLQAEEMIQAKLASSQRMVELHEVHEALASWKNDWTKWKTMHPLLSSEIPGWIPTRFDALVSKVVSVSQAFEQDQRSLRHMVDDHLAAMKQVLMLPVSTLVEGFPKLVRDLAREQGKEVELVLRGVEIEMDKHILEDLKDPLIHLVRNCVDHGIEKPESRNSHKKPESGTITLAFSTKDSRQVEILVSDDGAGIDVEQIRKAAIRSGVTSAEAAGKLDFQESLALIFQSGISTSEIITDISGRGLGLSIVREKVERLGGTVAVETQANQGTTFCLLLPLTLATFRGVLVRVNEQTFVIPTAHIEHSLWINREEIQTVKNQATIRLYGQILPLSKLGDILDLPSGTDCREHGGNQQYQASAPKSADSGHIPVLVLAFAEKHIAVALDEVLAEEEILVKPLGKQLSRVRNIAGAAVLGSGNVVPVLNIADLLKSALHPGMAAKALADAAKSSKRSGSILIAEDSITSRILLKNILETGGYQVATAVDGTDAFTQLRSAEFDLLVSDVDMPRMSGFELTAKIRGDKKLAELPVVLVTALESRQDRERGIEVGANAYIVKSSFDQSNLLEVIGRLL